MATPSSALGLANHHCARTFRVAISANLCAVLVGVLEPNGHFCVQIIKYGQLSVPIGVGAAPIDAHRRRDMTRLICAGYRAKCESVCVCFSTRTLLFVAFPFLLRAVCSHAVLMDLSFYVSIDINTFVCFAVR